MVKNMLYWSFWVILDPRGPLWDISNPAMFGHFWPKKGFLDPPAHMIKGGKGQNWFKPTLYMSKDYAFAVDSQSKHIYGPDNQNSDSKGWKMARFWPKLRYNSRVMAREVSFYQYLWVTKFWAKFGCSRTPRKARAPNSFIVLLCMWKEPAPFLFVCLCTAAELE